MAAAAEGREEGRKEGGGGVSRFEEGGARKGEQTFTCVRNYSRTSGVQMLRLRCVKHVMPSGGSCKVKGPSPPEGVGGGRVGRRRRRQAAGDPRDNNGDWENVGIVGPFQSPGAI